MIPIGKTILIEGELPKEQRTKEGIILPVFGSTRDYIIYIGYIREYGTGFTEQQKKDLLPIGTKVIMKYGTKRDKVNNTKLVFGEKIYYIYKPQDILCVIEE